MEFTEEQKETLLKLSNSLMKNEQKEADAVSGYVEQLDVIRETKEKFVDNEEVLELLNALDAATEEKIQDELNHGLSLYAEFTSITGIEAKKE